MNTTVEGFDPITEAAAHEIETLVNRWLATGHPLEILCDCFLSCAVDLSVDGAGAAGTAKLLRKMAQAVENGEMGEVLTFVQSN